MPNSYRISEVADLIGVPATTLRYYEDIGLAGKPARTSNGYRAYDDADLERLRFVVGVTKLGLALNDVRPVVEAYAFENCATVAHRVVELVAQRLSETTAAINELLDLQTRLSEVADRLSVAPAAVACGGDCPCATTAADVELQPRRVALDPADADRHPADVQLQDPSARPATDVAIACSLEPGALRGRLAQWSAVAARAERREDVDGGEALYFAADESVAAELAGLMAAEQRCCSFFTFDLRIATGGMRLRVLAPEQARLLVTELLTA